MKRYALYFSPPRGPLAETAAHWLGRDAKSGVFMDQPHADMAALTASARRYGFHATLKPPFRLRENRTVEELLATVDVVAAGMRPVLLDGLEPALIDGFLALLPVGNTDSLNRFASCIVTAFESFRAPLDEIEYARRQPDRLSTRQRELLDAYGYPYVMDEFRFHMTLSDRLDQTQAAFLLPLAKHLFTPALARPFKVDSIAVFGEADDGVFHEIHRTTVG